jgi:precorrin-6B methylase 2
MALRRARAKKRKAGDAPNAQAPPISKREWKELCEVMNGYIYSQTLVSACDLELFTYLSDHPGASRENLQRGLGLTEYCTRVLMLAACTTGLVLREPKTGKYYNSGLAQRVLVKGSPQSMLPFVQFNYRIQQRGSSQLTRSLRENRNAGLDEFPGEGANLYERVAGNHELENLFHDAMGAYTRLSPKMLELKEFTKVRHLVDIGGGDGSNAIRLCRLFPQLQITILEIPSVAQIARESVARAGFADRIRCVAGDMFADPWPEGCDAGLLSHVVEVFSPAKVATLYKTAYESLPVGGRLFVWTILANDEETGALQAAKSSIYFLCVASGEGMAHPAKEHKELMKAAGFRAVKTYSAAEIDHGAIVATK